MSRRGQYRRWTNDEREYVLRNYRKMRTCDIARALGRKWNQIDSMARWLITMAGKRWRDGRTPCTNCGEVVHRKPRKNQPRVWCSRQCSNDYFNGRSKAQRKARGDKRNRWTAEQQAFLRENYGLMTGPELARELGRGLRAVYIVAFRLGLRDPRKWTPSEDAFIIANQSKGWKWCAGQLGRIHGAVKTRARRLGIQAVRPVTTQRYHQTMLARHGVDSAGRLIHRRKQQVRKAVAAVRIEQLGKALEAACPTT